MRARTPAHRRAPTLSGARTWLNRKDGICSRTPGNSGEVAAQQIWADLL